MRYQPVPSIDARNAWRGDVRECARLYRQFRDYFRGNFYKICKHYGWKRRAMLSALRLGKF